MTPNVSAPSAAKTPSSHGTTGPVGNDIAALIAGTEPGQGTALGQQFNLLLQQQMGPAPMPATLAPALVAGEGNAEPGAVLADALADASTDDPVERNGDALAAAVLAMLGQANAIQTKVGGVSPGADVAVKNSHAGKAGVLLDAQQAAVASGETNTQPAAGDFSILLGGSAQPEVSARKGESDNGSLLPLAAPLSAHVGSAANPAAPTHTLSMNAPTSSPDFAQELGQHVAWVGNQELREARIRLRPEELGQLDVKVSVAEHGRVDVAFTAQHPAAVIAVQQTLGQLDSMLAGHGLSLGQAHVGQQDARRGERSGGGRGSDDSFAADAEPVESSVSTQVVGLVDAFA